MYKLCLLGATDKEIADFFEVAESTINLWKKKHKGFSESVRRGKIQADANVAQSLYKRATGYEYTETTYEKMDSLAGLELTTDEALAVEAYKKKVVTKHLVPDTGAAMNWLKNRRKDTWRDS